MATTQTASLALSTTPVNGDHMGGNIRGTFDAAGFSSTASGVILLGKIPVNAKNVQVACYYQTGSATYGLELGVRNGATTSATVSALGIAVEAGFIGPVYTPTWDDASGETFKYVQAMQDSGSVTASLTMNYSINWDM